MHLSPVLNKADSRFRELATTLDSISSDLHRQGIGAKKHSAPAIQLEHETTLWDLGFLGMSSPKLLQCTVFFLFFFYFGLNFVLRGIQEQYDRIAHNRL